MKTVIVEARPSDANGNPVDIRLAGGGRSHYLFKGLADWRAGVVSLPRVQAALGFGKDGFTGGAVAQASAIGFSPAMASTRALMAGLIWNDAAITVSIGDDRDGEPAWTVKLAGTVAGYSNSAGRFVFTLSDMAGRLGEPLVGGSFAGTGGIEGDAEAKGRVKRRSWGRCWNVEGRVLLAAWNIYEFGDPARQLGAFDAVKDKGRPVTIATVAWAGSVAATLEALKAVTVAEGGCAAAPSIGCVKWWTQPSTLTADLRGELGAGYVETVPAIAAAISAAAEGPAVDGLAALIALRPDPAGLHADQANETPAQMLDRLCLRASLTWTVTADRRIALRPVAFADPVETIAFEDVERRASYPPVAAVKIGWQKNHRVHTDGEISAAVLAGDVVYLDGQKVADLQPAQAGADVTGNNTSKDTAAVAGRPAAQVTAAIDASKVAIDKAQADLKTAQASLASDIAATQAQAAQNLDAVRDALNGDLKAARTSLASDISAAQGETAKVRSDLTDAVGGVRADAASAQSQAASAQRAASTVASDLLTEVARAQTEEGVLLTKVQTAQGRADSAYSAVTDETVNRAAADSVLAGRTSTVEAQLRGDQDSTIAARIRDEAATRASQDSAIAGRTATIEASYTAGGNLLTNTGLEQSTAGWSWAIPTGNWTFARADLTEAIWWPANTFPMVIRQYGTEQYNAWWYQDVPVLGGAWYQQSVYAASHRCAAILFIDWLDVSGNFIGNNSTSIQHFQDQRRSLSSYARLFQNIQAPANAVRALCYFGKGATSESDNSFAWLVLPQFVQSRQGVTEAIPYTPGSAVGDIINTNARLTDEAATRASQDSAIAGRVATTEAQLRGDQDSTIAARIRDEAATRASQDGAIAGRVATTEAQLRGDQDSTIAARIRDEAATRASQDGAIAGRVATTEAQLRGDQDSTIAARIRDEAATRASQDSAIAGRTATVEARAGDLEAKTGVMLTAVTDTTKKLESARLEFSAVTSGGRVAMVFRSDKNSGAGVDLIGDLRVSGDVVVDGTFKPTKSDKSSMSKEGQSSWSGAVTPAAGQSLSVAWSLGLGSIPPLGRFIWEFAAGVTTNAGRQEVTNYNGKPLYTNYRDDGGLVVRTTDNQGNPYDARSQGTSMIVASTAFDANFTAVISCGGYDSGIVNDGDYYTRTLSATYTVTSIRLKATWVAI